MFNLWFGLVYIWTEHHFICYQWSIGRFNRLSFIDSDVWCIVTNMFVHSVVITDGWQTTGVNVMMTVLATMLACDVKRYSMGLVVLPHT